MCRDAREGKLALLTSRKPGDDEEERFIFGVLDIADIEDDNPEGAQHFHGNPKTSVILDPPAYVKFWKYYSNPRSSDVILWGSGLFRYVDDSTARSFLDAIIATDGCSSDQAKRVKGLRSRF
jgi:hypothetical protein